MKIRNNGYRSDKTNLAELIEDGNRRTVLFKIPMYQRLFVWDDEQIRTFLEDILDSFYKKQELFIGTVVLTRQTNHSENSIVYDLVDGQQRITTLWLLSLVFSEDEYMGRFTSCTRKEEESIRMKFSIREEVSQFLESLWIDTRSFHLGENEGKPSQIQKKKLTYIKEQIALTDPVGESTIKSASFKDKRVDKIRNGLKVITQVLLERQLSIANKVNTKSKNSENSFQELSKHIFEKVAFVTVEAPGKSKLNQLFESLNNRGVQLLQEDVVKAKLFEKLSPEQRSKYNKLWTNCSDMDNYIEKNLRVAEDEDKSLGELLDKIHDFESIIKHVKRKSNHEGTNDDPNERDLLSILKNNGINFDSSDNKEEEDSESSSEFEVESILSFPQLLLHTLRIYDLINHREELSTKYENEDSDFFSEIDEKELIKIFKERIDEWDETQTEKFLRLLWDVRFTFDEVVVKWIEQGGERQLKLKTLEKSSDGKYIQRQDISKKSNKLELLQRMLYHTQDPSKHNWLTPYLYYSLSRVDARKGTVERLEEWYKLLEKIDNLMFCSDLSGDRKKQTQKIALDGIDELIAQRNFNNYEKIVEENLGLETPHYWFYKIDLLLYNNKDEYEYKILDWDNFKMSSRNSIEHVYPRNPKFKEEKSEEEIEKNSIGNLALVSTVDNSSYGSDFFTDKKNKYFKINNPTPPSLKLDLIYANPDKKWKNEQLKNHQKDIERLLSTYFAEFQGD